MPSWEPCHLPFQPGAGKGETAFSGSLGELENVGGLWLPNLVGGLLPVFGLALIQQPFDMKDEGMVAVDAVESRLRPIMMTTITTICGLYPLVFIPGEGTELYRGVGAIVLFGLIFSTAVTLSFLPALLSLVLGRRANSEFLISG